jgi:hypothetical protein
MADHKVRFCCLTDAGNVVVMSEPAVMEALSGAPALIVAFGGLKHGMGIGVPPFEFFRSLSTQGCDTIFVRDFRQAWYQFGIDTVIADVASLADWLRKRRRGYMRTVAVGNSMGGYAALLFGWLAELDVMIAFNPQTTIVLSDLAEVDDRRWQALIERIHARPTDRRYHDVRSVLSEGAERASLLFFGADCREDAAHAMRLAGEPGCHLFAIKDSSHRAVQQLRDSGTLARMFRMVSNPAIGVPALLEDLRADDRLAAIGCNARSQAMAGETA